MKPAPLARLLDETAHACRGADPASWTPEECDDVLSGLGTISYEIAGLSARIRAAKVNGTPVKHPVKPVKAPKPQPKPKPKPKGPGR